jgi:hypothetical protein
VNRQIDRRRFPGFGRGSLELFQELTEAHCRRHPVRRKAVAHDRLLLARVHRPHALRKLGLGSCREGVLSKVLCPRAEPHFRPEGSIKHLFWHGNTFQALQWLESLLIDLKFPEPSAFTQEMAEGVGE